MSRVSKSLTRRPWTEADHALLKKLAKQGMPGNRVAKQLKRTRGAVYQYASAYRIAFNGERATKRANGRTR